MEIELKFLIESDLNHQFITQLESSHYSVQFVSEQFLANGYFDTQDKVLRELDFGLRTRTKIANSGLKKVEQTIKLAGQDVGGLMQRPEYNIELEQDLTFPDLGLFPQEIWPSDLDINQLQHQLKRVFETQFTRKTWHVCMPNGAQIECVMDTGQVVATVNGEEQQSPINEFELELIKGNNQDLFELARYLVTHLPCKLGYLSKAARGYHLAQATEFRNRNLEAVSFSTPVLVESAFVQIFSYSIEFIQYHELLFSTSLKASSLRRIIDGMSLLIRALELLNEQVNFESCQRFIKKFKQLRAKNAWVESFYQLEKLGGRTSPYRKDIEKSVALTNMLASEQQPREKLEKASAQFSHADFNHLILSFIEWLSSKAWRQELSLTALSALAVPVNKLSDAWLQQEWQKITDQIEKADEASKSEHWEAIYWPIAHGLLTGICVGSLYQERGKSALRSHLINLLVGIEEAILLLKLEDLLQRHEQISEQDESNLKWLRSKQQSLNMALLPSVKSVLKLVPYWS